MGSKNKDRSKKSKTPSKKVSEESEKSELLNNNANKKSKIIEDPRFASAHSDPRFRKVPKHKSKVVIDSRFSRILTDKNFSSSSAPLDKRGRPRKQNAETSLRHYYRIEEEEEEEEEEEKKKAKEEKDTVTEGDESEEEESESEQLEELASEASGSESSDEEESEDEPEGGEVESSTDTDDEEIVYEDEEEEDMPDAEVENIPVIEQETRRLAVVNLDWRHVRAVDLYVVLRSFLPKEGEILSVSVYPSEFGLQRMKEEEIHGPVGLFDDGNEDDDDDDEIDPKKLREYEKSRLRYYYAVVECDTVSTADYLYKACDGVEFERSSNVLDLRFIPDSMEFKHPPRDVATEAPSTYEGLDFHTKALQHSNITITWDDDEPQRAKTLIRKFNDDQLAEQELKDYLASDDSETEDDDDDDIDGEDQSDKKHKDRDKYIALIQSGDVSDEDSGEKAQDMEVTFNTGLEDLSQRILEKKDKKSESVWEATLRKQRDKKMACKTKSKYSSEEDSSDTDGEAMEQQEDDFFVDELPTDKGYKKDRRFKSDGGSKKIEDAERGGEASMAELELLLADDKGADNGLKGYNLKRKKAKGKKGKELPDEDKIPTLAYDDSRFSALFTSPLYALDPTDPQYKRSASYARQVIQKQHKVDGEQLVEGSHEKPPAESLLPSDEHGTDNNEDVSSEVPSSKKGKYELSSLVRSVKMKSKQVQLPSNTKVSKKREKFGEAKQMENPDLATFIQLAKKKKKIHK